MFTQDFFEKHFKLYSKLVLYTKDGVKVEFTKEPHFHMNGGYHTLDLMDTKDLMDFCNARGLQVKPSNNVVE